MRELHPTASELEQHCLQLEAVSILSSSYPAPRFFPPAHNSRSRTPWLGWSLRDHDLSRRPTRNTREGRGWPICCAQADMLASCTSHSRSIRHAAPTPGAAYPAIVDNDASARLIQINPSAMLRRP